MGITMGLREEMELFGERVPFIAERDYRAFLPAELRGGGKKIEHAHDALALLLSRHDGRVLRGVHHDGQAYAVEILILGGYGGDQVTRRYLIPLATTLALAMIERGWLAGTPRIGYVDMSALTLTDKGIEELFRYLKELPL